MGPWAPPALPGLPMASYATAWARSFTESYLSDIDNIIAPFEITTPVNQNLFFKIKAGWAD